MSTDTKLKLFKLYLAVILAVFALLDNATTWLAVSAGAIEVNPIVYPFLGNIHLFALFTAAKVLICFFVVYRYIEPKLVDILAYSAVLFVFVRAAVINILNYIILAR